MCHHSSITTSKHYRICGLSVYSSESETVYGILPQWKFTGLYRGEQAVSRYELHSELH